jgi:hypothetical protein
MDGRCDPRVAKDEARGRGVDPTMLAKYTLAEVIIVDEPLIRRLGYPMDTNGE